MKKLLAILLAAVMCVTFCACGKPAPSPAEDFSYEFEDGTVTITGYSGADLDVVVPSTIEGRLVTVIGAEAFKDYDMNSIVLPDGLKLIGSQAFYSCSNLKKLIIPDSVEEIQSWAFGCCESLAEIEIPDSVTYIGSHGDIFHRCENLTVYGKSGSYIYDYIEENKGVYDSNNVVFVER